MNKLREAAQQALEVLEFEVVATTLDGAPHLPHAITALRAALAQPEPEPVAWRYDEATYRPDDLRGRQWHFTLFSTRKPYADEMVQNVTPLYTTPPQRKPLTEEEIAALSEQHIFASRLTKFVRAIEKAHGIGGEE